MLQYICSTVKSLLISKKGYGRVNERGKLSNFTLTWFGFMVFNTTFKNISVISWQFYFNLFVSVKRVRRGRNRMVVDLELPMQSVSITTNIVSSNTAQTRYVRYNIM
jgi:hypothetical protein